MSYLATLLADARLPSGGHTQSAGAEPALLAGLSTADLPALIRGRLATVTATEATTAVVARHVHLSGGDLAAVNRAFWVRTPVAALREASAQAARGWARMLPALGGEPLPPGRWCRPVVLGVAAASCRLSAAQTAELIGYDDVQTVLAAALKLAPFDPVLALRWAVDAEADVAVMVEKVCGCTTPDEIPAVSAPLAELWADTHAHAERRLFRA